MKVSRSLPNGMTNRSRDWVIGHALGKEPRLVKYNDGIVDIIYKNVDNVNVTWSPSTIWEQGGPLIEKYKISITYNDTARVWVAQPYGLKYSIIADTPLEAAMYVLAYEILKDAEDFYIPDELFID